MVTALDSHYIAFVNTLIGLARSGLHLSLFMLMATIVAGKFFYIPVMQRLSITLVCAVAAFNSLAPSSESHYSLMVATIFVFYLVYYESYMFAGDRFKSLSFLSKGRGKRGDK